jgi:Mismatch repair ATPase (MutS family)
MEKLIERKKRKQEREKRGKNGETEKPIKQEPKKELKINDKVKVKNSQMFGEVIEIGDNWVNIAIGNIISRVKKEDITIISNNEYNSTIKPPIKKGSIYSEGLTERKLNFKPNIDIRGKRLNEALEIVSRFIDDALMVGMEEVKILHGKGNGILKEEIRKYLRTMHSVTNCKDEDIQYGGSGITVVTLE